MQLDLNIINSLLETKVIGQSKSCPNEFHVSIDSTNNKAIELAKLDDSNGVFVIAQEQTAGRGRQGRKFVSPSKQGLYMSLVLKVPNYLNLNLLTMALGVAVATMIEDKFNHQIELKWINDLIFKSKKLGGILVELPYLDSDQFNIIIGIGINLYPFDYQKFDLNYPIEFMSNISQNFDLNFFVKDLLYYLEKFVYIDLLNNRLDNLVVDNWKKYNCTLGKDIRIIQGNNISYGRAIDINELGELVVESNGRVLNLNAGEVSMRRLNGHYL